MDEIVTFIPDLTGPPGAFKVLIADPALGVEILESEPDILTATLGKYPEQAPTVAQALERYRDANLEQCAIHMQTTKTTLMNELGLPPEAFVNIPAYFMFSPSPPGDEPDYSEAYSLSAGLVQSDRCQ